MGTKIVHLKLYLNDLVSILLVRIHVESFSQTVRFSRRDKILGQSSEMLTSDFQVANSDYRLKICFSERFRTRNSFEAGRNNFGRHFCSGGGGNYDFQLRPKILEAVRSRRDVVEMSSRWRQDGDNKVEFWSRYEKPLLSQLRTGKKHLVMLCKGILFLLY